MARTIRKQSVKSKKYGIYRMTGYEMRLQSHHGNKKSERKIWKRYLKAQGARVNWSQPWRQSGPHSSPMRPVTLTHRDFWSAFMACVLFPGSTDRAKIRPPKTGTGSGQNCQGTQRPASPARDLIQNQQRGRLRQPKEQQQLHRRRDVLLCFNRCFTQKTWAMERESFLSVHPLKGWNGRAMCSSSSTASTLMGLGLWKRATGIMFKHLRPCGLVKLSCLMV